MSESDVDKLKREHPGWRIGTTWATANTRPDTRRLTASRDGILLSAWNATELAAKIRQEDAARTYGGGQP